MSYMDLAIIIVIVLFALLGLWKGFFKTLISFCGWLVCFLIAFFITKPIAYALLDAAKVRNFVVGNSGWTLYTWIYSRLPDLSSGGFLGKILSRLLELAVASGGDVKQNMALMLANGVFSILVFFGLLITVRLLLLLLTMFLNAMSKGKLVGAANRLLGLLFGFLRGFGVVIIAMVVMTFVMGLSFMAPIHKQMDKSVIAAPIYTQVSKITDKFLSGDDETLNKLRILFERNNQGNDSQSNDANYIFRNDVGEYVLKLNDDGTYTLTVNMTEAEDSAVYSGTYSVDGEKISLVFKEQTTEGIKKGNWIYWQRMLFAAEGTTAPEYVVVATYTATDGDTSYTFTLYSNDTYTLRTAAGDAVTDEQGTCTVTEDAITILPQNGEVEEQCPLTDGVLRLRDKDFVKQ